MYTPSCYRLVVQLIAPTRHLDSAEPIFRHTVCQFSFRIEYGDLAHRWFLVKKISFGVMKSCSSVVGVSALHGLTVCCINRESRAGSVLKGSSIADAGTLPSTRSLSSTLFVKERLSWPR